MIPCIGTDTINSLLITRLKPYVCGLGTVYLKEEFSKQQIKCRAQ